MLAERRSAAVDGAWRGEVSRQRRRPRRFQFQSVFLRKSEIATMPTTRPSSSTTGTPRILRWRSTSQTADSGVCGDTEVTLRVMMSRQTTLPRVRFWRFTVASR